MVWGAENNLGLNAIKKKWNRSEDCTLYKSWGGYKNLGKDFEWWNSLETVWKIIHFYSTKYWQSEWADYKLMQLYLFKELLQWKYL